MTYCVWSDSPGLYDVDCKLLVIDLFDTHVLSAKCLVSSTTIFGPLKGLSPYSGHPQSLYIDPSISIHQIFYMKCVCVSTSELKKFEDKTTNNPLSLLRPPSSNNQLWPLRRWIASRRGVVSVGNGVGVGCSGGGGRGQHEDDGNNDDAMTML